MAWLGQSMEDEEIKKMGMPIPERRPLEGLLGFFDKEGIPTDCARPGSFSWHLYLLHRMNEESKSKIITVHVTRLWIAVCFFFVCVFDAPEMRQEKEKKKRKRASTLKGRVSFDPWPLVQPCGTK